MQKDSIVIQEGYMGRITYYNRETGETTYEFLGRTTRAAGMTPYVTAKSIPNKLKTSVNWVHGPHYKGSLQVLKAEVVKIEQRVVDVVEVLDA